MPFDPAKFENPLQLGGIRTGSLDTPGSGGGGTTRVALFHTTKTHERNTDPDTAAGFVEISLTDCDL